MMRSRRITHLISLIAILAIWLNMFMPLVSNVISVPATATPVGSTGSWTEICSSFGSKWVRYNSSGTPEFSSQKPSDAPLKLEWKHCAYCLPHGGTDTLPASHYPFASPDTHSSRLIVRVATFFLSRFAWLTPRVRAPPAFS
ncbi:MAG: DUF2946 domain-containing protein [Undibacterium curvum]|uniref:DUF2946 domain-containing protein n=1 Tax=Undibacterium curvum TaxID=2762294 RepID=UPI003BBC8BAD